jgi:trafficking protein particle complex subunit 10
LQDIETYKAGLKDELDSWLKQLNALSVTDWMILIVETIDIKKTKNILPRQSVIDKIRIDFASKNADRCVSILNPLKFENKATESFRSMVQRIRHLILSGYNKNIIKFEEIIRSKREERNKEDWDFCKYFLLQEQLAFVLEMLSLHSDALVQYDELDAMFNLFIMNTMYGEKPKWMKTFEKPLNNLRGITMCNKDMQEVRKKIDDESVTLIELRNYLFQRQCVLLNAMGHQHEIAQRLFPFLFSTLRETEALRQETYNGSLACWQFVNCLEVLNLCDCVNGTENIIKCSQYTASIWNLAKDKLYELGKLCGLLPNCTPTSEQLHIVVQLSSAIGDAPERDAKEQKKLEIARSHSPVRRIPKAGCEKLREALGSNDGFKKLYLELSELAISTYKHVSRLRSARLVGLDLGNFYCALNEPQKAIVFFTDLLRELKTEKWSALASQTLLELASCYKKMNDSLSYTKVCAAISCCVDLETLVRTFYFDEFLKSLKSVQSVLNVSERGPSNYVNLEDHFKIIDVHLFNKSPVIQDSLLTLEFKIDCNFPREVICEVVALSFELVGKQPSHEIALLSNEFDMLPFTVHLDYKQDNSLSSANVVCETKEKVRRTSSGKNENSPTVRSDFTNAATLENVLFHPGVNVITLKTKASQVGAWNFKQISIQFQNLDFLSKTIPIKLKPFEITTKPSSAALHFSNLVAGLDQTITMMISGGSFHFPKETSITLKGSKGLKLRFGEDSEYQRTISIPLIDFKLFEERNIELQVLCELPCRRDEALIEQKVMLQSPWSESEIQIPLKFLPILTACCRLHSSGSKKFLQVITKSLLDKDLIIMDAIMKCEADGVIVNDLNPTSQSKLTVAKNISVSYLYEIEVEPLKTQNELPVISIEFNLMYAEADKPDLIRRYTCPFDVTDYKTLFEVKVKVEPSELCRVGSVCHLNLTITKLSDQNQHNDLMYEVLFDQNIWAVYGRSAGVISMADLNETMITLDVFPLTAGFLPLPNIRLSKYVANATKNDNPKLAPFAPTQVYNSTKSLQIHVLASSNVEPQ